MKKLQNLMPVSVFVKAFCKVMKTLVEDEVVVNDVIILCTHTSLPRCQSVSYQGSKRKYPLCWEGHRGQRPSDRSTIFIFNARTFKLFCNLLTLLLLSTGSPCPKIRIKTWRIATGTFLSA